jgi:hypothetical protein
MNELSQPFEFLQPDIALPNFDGPCGRILRNTGTMEQDRESNFNWLDHTAA